MSGAIAVARGCGTRKKGGIYFETGLGRHGLPLEYFIVDPPILIDDWHLSPLGVQLIKRNGITHILDWVGSEHYPNVADYLEEVRRFGVSRRLAKTLDFSQISEQTRILLVHARAWVDNFHDYKTWECPKEYAYHSPEVLSHEPEGSKRMCSGVWWEDVEGGVMKDDDRTIQREMPSFTYYAKQRPDEIKAQYRPAIFASFPCSRLVVVKGDHEESLAKVSKAAVEVKEVDQ
jgi:hypothetical protein